MSLADHHHPRITSLGLGIRSHRPRSTPRSVCFLLKLADTIIVKSRQLLKPVAYRELKLK